MKGFDNYHWMLRGQQNISLMGTAHVFRNMLGQIILVYSCLLDIAKNTIGEENKVEHNNNIIPFNGSSF